MTTVNVQWAETTEDVIISYFGSHQPDEGWPNQSVIETSDPRWLVYYDAQPLTLQRVLPAPVR
jgi:hypothetical protein